MIQIGVLIFPQVEELDFVGPFEILSHVNYIKENSTNVVLVAEKQEPIIAYNGMKILPDISIEKCPQLDILVVPGGKGRLQAMKNQTIKSFIMKQSKGSKYITSVCTGAFILAEAGVLKGKRATTYHAAFQELEKYPSIKVEKAKVVQDGNIITGAGVSSGIELGLYLLKVLFGAELAQEVAVSLEYSIDVKQIT